MHQRPCLLYFLTNRGTLALQRDLVTSSDPGEGIDVRHFIEYLGGAWEMSLASNSERKGSWDSQ